MRRTSLRIAELEQQIASVGPNTAQQLRTELQVNRVLLQLDPSQSTELDNLREMPEFAVILEKYRRRP